MKQTRRTEKKEKIYTMFPGILVLTMISLLCIPQIVPTTYAQSTSSNVGWYGAMAMGNLAEEERMIEEQRPVRKDKSKFATVLDDRKVYGNGPEEKDLAEK